MKKLLALMLAAALALSLVACGGGSGARDNNSTNTPSTENGDTTSTDTPSGGSEEQGNNNANTQYAIGDTFGTDTIECVITAADWIGEEDLWVPELVSDGNGGFVAGGSDLIRQTKLDYFYPGYQFIGLAGFSSKPIETPYFCVTLTLQNIGKEEISPEIDGYGDYMDFVPYGNIAVLYDDGYVFESENGFTSTLKILSDKDLQGRVFELPEEVSENTDKPLMLRVTLPNSTGESEEFIIAIR